MAIFKGGKGRDDTFTGTDASDQFLFDPADLTGADRISGGGGSGVDTLKFTAGGAVTADMLAQVTGIEQIMLSDAGNTVTLTNGLLATATGKRLEVVGGAGADVVDGSSITAAYRLALTGGAGDTLIGGAGRDVISGASTIAGGGGADTLTGVRGTRFVLRDGDFARGEVIRSPGESVLQVYGSNDLRLGKVSGLIGVTLGDFGDQGVKILTAFSSQLAAVRSVGGYGGQLEVIMDKAGVVMPMLIGSDGSQTTINVTGTRGRDTIQGRFTDVHAGDGNDVISNTFAVYGTDGAAIALYGEGGDDIITKRATGTGLIDGGSGVDTMKLVTQYDDWTYHKSLTINLGNVDAQITYDAFHAAGFENVDLSGVFSQYETKVKVTGSDAANVLIGSGNDDTIDGAAGNDVIAGGEGADKLTGGSGADRFEFTTRGRESFSSDGSVDVLTDYDPEQDTLAFARKTASGNVLFDYNGGKFDTLVTADGQSTNLRGADLVIYSAGRLGTPESVAEWIAANGTGSSGEGLFIMAENAARHAILYYAPDAHVTSTAYAVQAIADLGTIAPSQLQLSDFAFI